MTRVLITGNAGFIGTHLWRELDRHGYDLCGHDKQDGDLTTPGVFAAHLDSCEPDLVIHLAAQVGRLFGEQDLTHTISSNATMTALVAYACGTAKIPVLYASTSEAYGDWGDTLCFEGMVPRLPHNAYGLSKRHGEEFLQLYAPENLKIVRLSMPAGPGAPPGVGRRALDTMLWQAHHQMPLCVHRGAERAWCHVSDTVRGIRMVIEQGSAGVYNIGRDDNPVSMLALAEMCCDLAGAPRELIGEVDPPGAQTVVKRLSTRKLRELGWQPTLELPAILDDIYRWVQNFDRDGVYRP